MKLFKKLFKNPKNRMPVTVQQQPQQQPSLSTSSSSGVEIDFESGPQEAAQGGAGKFMFEFFFF